MSIMINIPLSVKVMFYENKISRRKQFFNWIIVIIIPLLGLLNYLVFYKIGIFKISALDMPYVFYLISGIVFYSAIILGIQSTVNSFDFIKDFLIKNELKQINFFILSYLQTFVSFMGFYVVLIIFNVLMGMKINWWYFVSLILVLPILNIGVSLGVVLSLINIAYKDIVMIFNQILSSIMIFFPIIIPRSSNKDFLFNKIYDYNIFTGLIEVPRNLIFYQKLEITQNYIIVTFSSFVIVFLTYILFSRLKVILYDRI